MVADTGNLAGAAVGKKKSAKAAGEPLGWQELVLNRNAVCERCNAILAKGAKGGMAIYGPGDTGPSIIVCPDCMKGDPS